MKFIYEQIETGGVSKVNILAHRFLRPDGEGDVWMVQSLNRIIFYW